MANMYRTKTVQYYGPGGECSVTVKIDLHHTGLVDTEMTSAINNIADETMLMLNRTRFVHAPLSKIKVSSPRR